MRRILVTYATRAGSTAEVATSIAEALRAGGATVDVLPIKAMPEVDGYDAVVVGSPIHMGHWLPEAVAFVKANRWILSYIPTAYFVVSEFLREDTPEMRQKVQAYLDPVCAMLEPTSVGVFAGKIDYHKLSWLDRTIAKAAGTPEGDWRNWEAIRQWARELQASLVHASEPLFT
jgi:menaquinone-dependent protoporphyrinogen oxidase